eukprot:COSAG01_NODE_1316_length_10755_cov_4.749343_8_plen_84_part_00
MVVAPSPNHHACMVHGQAPSRGATRTSIVPPLLSKIDLASILDDARIGDQRDCGIAAGSSGRRQHTEFHSHYWLLDHEATRGE